MKRPINLLACIVGAISLALAASSDGTAPRVELVFARNLVVIDQRIVAGPQEVVVPICDVGGKEHLCWHAFHIEVQSGPKWVPASLSYVGGIPGGIPLERARVLKVEPGANATIRAAFLKRDYVFKPGQMVRLRVDTWRSEAAMRAHNQPLTLVTSPFSID